MVEEVITISLGEEGYWHTGASKNRAGRGRCHIFNVCFNSVLQRKSWPMSRVLSATDTAIWPQGGRRKGIRAWVEETRLPLSRASHMWNSAGTSWHCSLSYCQGFHWTAINSTLHLCTSKWLTKGVTLINPLKSPKPQGCIGAAYLQIGKLKQKRGCETPKKRVRGRIRTGRQLSYCQTVQISQFKKQILWPWHLPHPIFANRFYWEKLPKCPVLDTCAKMWCKERLPFTLKPLALFFVTPEWEDARPLASSYLRLIPPI